MSSYQDQNQQMLNLSAYNTNYNTPSAIEIRLDTDGILEKLERWLSGKKSILKTNPDGSVDVVFEKLGLPKANEEGVNSILSLITSVFNSQFVQGNFTNEDRYDMFIEEFHDSVLWNCWINMFDWGIKENDYELIVDEIVHAMIGFSSRLIGNKERDSYENTIRTIESSHVRESQGNKGFNLFGGRNTH